MKAYVVNITVLVLIIGFSVWLYAHDEAARPGALSSAHQQFGECQNCHVPWKGVEDQMCLQCHFFDNVASLKPQIRFHEAEKNCLECHTEHLGAGADISVMDHTLLNGALKCTQCHVDPHDQKFGSDCRACHGINQWSIEGFRHPPAENKDCSRCHRAPASHYDDRFWEEIRQGHMDSREQPPPRSPEDCFRCHITHRWDHLRMSHGLQLPESDSGPAE